MTESNLIEQAINIVGLQKLTTACGLASSNSLRKWRTAGKVPLDNAANYPAVIEQETDGQITAAQIWLHQLDDLRPAIVYALPVEILERDPDQPRVQFHPILIKRLAASLKRDGQESPIKFRRNGQQLLIKHGERRLRAAKRAKLPYILGILDDTEETAAERILRQALDNTGEQLTPWDWACTIERLHNGGMGITEISNALMERGLKGFSRPVVSNFNRLHQLPVWAKHMIRDGWLTPSHGKYLLAIKHDGVLASLGNKYRSRQAENQHPPAVGYLDADIRDAYDQLFPRIDGYSNTNGPGEYICKFDTNQCEGCQHAHQTKLNNGHVNKFCLDIDCYNQKTTAAKKAAEAKKQPTPTETTPTKPAQGRTKEPTKDLDPTPPTTPGLEACQQAQISRAEKTERLESAIQTADPDDALAIIGWFAYDDLDGDRTSLQQLRHALDHDRTRSLRTITAHLVNVIGDTEIQEVARFLHVDLDGVSKETNTEQDALL